MIGGTGADSSASLAALLHLCDSLFPIGAYAHSDGLEAAAATGLVATAEGFCSWMEVCLEETLGRYEGPSVVHAWRAADERRWSDLLELDADVHAMRPASTSRRASRAMGARLLKVWQQARPDLLGRLQQPEDASHEGFTLPVAFAVVCVSARIELRATLTGYFYTRLAGATSAAMRLIPLGQGRAHMVLASMLKSVPAVVEAVLESAEPPLVFAPAADIAAMTQQYLHSRLFKS